MVACTETSTNQEVQQQYELYDHYVPGRMEVIPPGVDLSRFAPAKTNWKTPAIADNLACFLRIPDKPMILTVARPDERKNLETLVRTYGESEQLQERANLVIVMGTRDDVRELPKSQQAIINNVLYLIDRFVLPGPGHFYLFFQTTRERLRNNGPQ
jgi:sucrose-phosphate synthase